MFSSLFALSAVFAAIFLIGVGLRRMAGLPFHFFGAIAAGFMGQVLVFLITRSYAATTAILLVPLLWALWKRPWPPMRRPKWCALGFVFALLFAMTWLTLIFLVPTGDWDAQASWFFRGHVFANEGGFYPRDWWTTRPYEFARWEYPPAFPVWVGQVEWALRPLIPVATPKIMVGVLFLVSFVSLLRARREGWGWIWLMISIFCGLHRYLWNGYMDGYLAIFYGLGLLSIERWRRNGPPEGLVTALAVIAWLPLLKDEGLVLSATLILFLLWANAKAIFFQLPLRREMLFWTAIGFVPFALWAFYRKHFSLSSWLTSEGAWETALSRVHEGWASKIATRLLWDSWVVRGWLLVAVLFAVSALRKRARPADLGPILISLIYFAALWVVYLITPIGPDRQLSLTQDRVVFPIRVAAFIGLLLVAESLLAPKEKEVRREMPGL